jgi:hypothetical protein
MTVFDMARKKAAASVRVVLRLWWVGALGSDVGKRSQQRGRNV